MEEAVVVDPPPGRLDPSLGDLDPALEEAVVVDPPPGRLGRPWTRSPPSRPAVAAPCAPSPDRPSRAAPQPPAPPRPPRCRAPTRPPLHRSCGGWGGGAVREWRGWGWGGGVREEDLGCGEGDENERKSEMRVPNPSSSFYTQRQKSGLAGPTGPRPFTVADLIICPPR